MAKETTLQTGLNCIQNLRRRKRDFTAKKDSLIAFARMRKRHAIDQTLRLRKFCDEIKSIIILFAFIYSVSFSTQH